MENWIPPRRLHVRVAQNSAYFTFGHSGRDKPLCAAST
jgi:hypothetical protein